jgi:hypothetical protein
VKPHGINRDLAALAIQVGSCGYRTIQGRDLLLGTGMHVRVSARGLGRYAKRQRAAAQGLPSAASSNSASPIPRSG